MSEREMVSADEARAMEHRSDGCDEAADVMHMERSALRARWKTAFGTRMEVDRG